MTDISSALAAGNASGRFTTKGATEQPRTFSVDDEVYYVAAELPADVMTNVSAYAEATGADRIRLVGDFLTSVMLPESATRYLARLKSPERPISLYEAVEHVLYLLREVYGVTRPSDTPSSSPAG
jgi:hypothetical protein